MPPSSQGTLFEQLDRTPLTYLVLLAYVTLAALTDPVSPSLESLVRYGACSQLLATSGEPWRLVTSAFLHGNLIHLLFVGYFLLMIGPMLEQTLGSLRFAVLYIVSAVGGNIGASLWASHSVAETVVGGSGAMFGMCGAVVAINMRSGQGLFDFMQFRGPRSIVMLIGFNLLLGLILDFVSNSSHVGGLIAGFVLTFLFLDRGRYDKPDAIARTIQAGWIALFVSLTIYVLHPVGHAHYVLLRDEVERYPDSMWPPESLRTLHPSFLDKDYIVEALGRWRSE